MTTPLENPTVYDTIYLDQVESPGLCERVSGGERKNKFDNQQGPGTSGAYTVAKGQEVATIEYQFVLWLPEHFAAWDVFRDMLKTGMKLSPPQVHDLVDEAIVHNDIHSVCTTYIGKQEKVSPTKWGYKVGFTEYRKKQSSGGAVKSGSTKSAAAKTAQEKAIDELNDQNKKLQADLDAKKKEMGL